MTRARLPDRRPAVTERFSYKDTWYEVTIGFDPATARPAEIFLSGAKEGTDMEHLLADIAVVVSIALQSGQTIESLSKSLARLPAVSLAPADLDNPPKEYLPASVIGAALKAVSKVEEWAKAA